MRRLFRLPFFRHIEREVDDELAFHIAMREEALVREGMSPDEARREAHRRFGDERGVRSDVITLDQERVRAMERTRIFADIWQDVVYAARTLRRNPGFTLIAVTTLALGIGANTAVFALVDAVLLRPLNVPAPNELVIIGDPARPTGASVGVPRFDLLSYPAYQTLRARSRSFSGLMAGGRTNRLFMTSSGRSEPVSPRGRFVSDNYFSVLRVPAALGRTFGTTEAGSAGPSQVAVISYDYWKTHFNGDRSAVGSVVTVNRQPLTIVGVAARDFQGEAIGAAYDIWLPLSVQPLLMPNQDYLKDPFTSWLILMGRRNDGVSLERAQSELRTLIPSAIVESSDNAAFQASARAMSPDRLMVSDGSKGLSRTRPLYSRSLMTLLAGVGILLLIVCANVANLMLARATARVREMSVRAAIGAGRWRVLRQLLTESVVLALVGSAAGLVLGYLGSQVLIALAADGTNAIAVDVAMQGRVTLFAVGAGMLAALFFGLAPAIAASRVQLADAMRASSRAVASGSGRGASPTRLVIAAQVALSLPLLVTATLLARSTWQLRYADLGMDREHLIVVDVDARSRGYMDTLRFAPFADDMVARLRRIPGVASVTFSENGLYNSTESVSSVSVQGYAPSTSSDSALNFDQVGLNYAATIGARIVEGRDTDERDHSSTATEMLLNQTAARAYFGNTSAIGKLILAGGVEYRVAGVIADAQDHAIRAKPVRRGYTSFYNPNSFGSIRFIVRTNGNPALLAQAVRREVVAADQLLPILSIAPLPLLLRASIRAERLSTQLAIAFSVLALVLAAIGLYGVMSYAVSRRINEIGVRVALGAQRRDVISMVLSEAVRTVLIGSAVGVGLSLYLAQFLTKTQLLYETNPRDTLSIVGAVVVLSVTAVLAAFIPAMRGAAIEPVQALRES